MGQSLILFYAHIVFSTKNRAPMISDDIREELHSYLGGICKENGCIPIKIGGTNDHVHILCRMSKQLSLSKLIQALKANSSKWVKTKGVSSQSFAWQSGYGAFSVNPQQVDVISKYILNQEEHHKKRSFKEEYLKILKKYNVEYDHRYIWD
ncbi:REP element-mobilizing transposase RayT [Cyclonatronum proteinivorum]|uniref:REP element-mobilizing transposase RayT n=1 Tax=Cyclonatronum proteinivorum TaxID=1457365 RepID=A0A345UKS1_9BACT|nr:IS200/IS605 family transposase [Cyclonatronum proteinivorum]AXJ01073.1 REP element-mobilizing transposase RayT [Cyclonatronum proteinivorum]